MHRSFPKYTDLSNQRMTSLSAIYSVTHGES